MTVAGVVVMLIVPAVLVIGAGLLLAGNRWNFVPDDVVARSRTPAEALSYLAFGFVAFVVVSAVVAAATGRPEQQQLSSPLWLSVYIGFWFSPYLLAGALLRRLASVTTAPPEDDTAATGRNDAGDAGRVVRSLKVAGRAALALWLAAVSAWTLGAALNVTSHLADVTWNDRVQTVLLVVFATGATVLFFRALRSPWTDTRR